MCIIYTDCRLRGNVITKKTINIEIVLFASLSQQLFCAQHLKNTCRTSSAFSHHSEDKNFLHFLVDFYSSKVDMLFLPPYQMPSQIVL